MNKIALFFERIGLPADTPVERTVDFLRLVQYQCVTHIPYENIDIMDDKPLNLDPDALFEKIVLNNRGGYCFELNALLSSVLKEMGFKVTDYLARFLRQLDYIPVRHHRVVAVELLDKTYICDIGIGSKAPRHPLELTEGLKQNLLGEEYYFEKDKALGWVLYENHHGEYGKYISFTCDPQLEVDFILPSFYCEKHPDSKFNKVLMVAMKTPEGRKTIDGDEYREYANGQLLLTEKLNADRLNSRLKNDFFFK